MFELRVIHHWYRTILVHCTRVTLKARRKVCKVWRNLLYHQTPLKIQKNKFTWITVVLSLEYTSHIHVVGFYRQETNLHVCFNLKANPKISQKCTLKMIMICNTHVPWKKKYTVGGCLFYYDFLFVFLEKYQLTWIWLPVCACGTWKSKVWEREGWWTQRSLCSALLSPQ